MKMEFALGGVFVGFSAQPADDDWGSGESGTWKARTGKYSNTGERWYGVKIRGSSLLFDGAVGALNDCAGLRLKHGAYGEYTEFVKGENFPFSQ
jgi:hypothetical protein